MATLEAQEKWWPISSPHGQSTTQNRHREPETLWAQKLWALHLSQLPQWDLTVTQWGRYSCHPHSTNRQTEVLYITRKGPSRGGTQSPCSDLHHHPSSRQCLLKCGHPPSPRLLPRPDLLRPARPMAAHQRYRASLQSKKRILNICVQLIGMKLLGRETWVFGVPMGRLCPSGSLSIMVSALWGAGVSNMAATWVLGMWLVPTEMRCGHKPHQISKTYMKTRM